MSTVDAASMAEQFAYYDIYSAETRYNNKLSDVTSKRSAFASLQTSLNSLKTALYDFTKYNGTVEKAAATLSSEDYLSVSASENAANADLDIFVKQTASVQQYAFDLTALDEDGNTVPVSDPQQSIDPQTGVMTISRGDDEIYTIDINDLASGLGREVTYQDVVNEINSQAGDSITANLVQTNGELKLLVSSDETGEDNAFTMDFAPENATDENPFGNALVLKEAQDAIIVLGGETGLELTNSSNTFTDLVDGVDVTIIKAQATGTDTTNVTVGTDLESSTEALQTFIDKFNETIDKLNDLTATSSSEDGSRGVLASDSTARGIKSALTNALRGEFDGNYLFQIGIEVDRDGKLSLDEDAFEEAFNNSEIDIDAMLTGENGAFKVLESTIDMYSNTTTGTIKSRIDTLDRQKSNINDNLEALELRYEKAYNRYLKQFTAMNEAVYAMESALSSFSY